MNTNALIATFLFIKAQRKMLRLIDKVLLQIRTMCAVIITISRFIITFNEIFHRIEITNKSGKHFPRCFLSGDST